MYRIKYKIAKYKEAKYGKTPTKYLVPTSIDKMGYDSKTDTPYVVETYTGRIECGKVIAQARNDLKDYMKLLEKHYGPDLTDYTDEMTKHRNKEGFFDPKYGNYNAKRMCEDKAFIPDRNQKFFKKYWGKDVWTDDSPVPNYNEPYWHTEHSIQKSNDWIFEHLDRMRERVHQNELKKEYFKIICETVNKGFMELAN